MTKFIILCGGRGARLAEQTEFIPKPMVKIGDMPILWHIMKTYGHYGFKDFVLPLGYKGEMIKTFFSRQNFPEWNIEMRDTGLDTRTTKRIFQVKDLLQGSDFFMVTYGDGVANINIADLIKYHKQKGLLATITGYKPEHRYGIVEEKNGVVTMFKEKPKMIDFVNCGFMVFQKEALKYFDCGDIMLEEMLPSIAKDRQLALYPHDGKWYCMDTQREYEILNELWKKDPWWKVWQ